MNFYERVLLPRILDFACSRRYFNRLRAALLPEVRGHILEIGFGSGTSLPYYTGAVTRLVAVDPVLLGRRLAAGRLKSVSFPVQFAEADPSGDLPLADACMDGAVTCFTLCSVSNPEQLLAEVMRILKPGGRLYFIEHGLSDRPGVARLQRLLTPLQKSLAGGCHLDRPTDALLKRAGFDLIRLRHPPPPGPWSLAHMYLGVAVKRP